MNLWSYLLRAIRAGLSLIEAAYRAVASGMAPSETAAMRAARIANRGIEMASTLRDLPDDNIRHGDIPIRPELDPFTIQTEILATWKQGGVQRSHVFVVDHGEGVSFNDLIAGLQEQLAEIISDNKDYGQLTPGSVAWIPMSIFRGYWR